MGRDTHRLRLVQNVSDEDKVALNAVRDCIRDLQDWLVRDRLKLNNDKTEFLLLFPRQQLVKVNLSSITVDNEAKEAKSEVRTLILGYGSTRFWPYLMAFRSCISTGKPE